MMDQCRQKMLEGELTDAWAACGVALQSWLVARWEKVSGKRANPAHDIADLLAKLRSGGILDAWLYNALKLALKRPESLTLRHVAIFAALVSAVCFDTATV